MKRRTKHPEDMSAAELTEATKQFDEPFIFEKSRPMTAAQRAQERKLRRGRGRPKVGKGAKKISISLEGNLLQRADALATKKGVNRSQLIADFVAAGLRRKAV
ncbi:MAG: hypothetical protein ABR964_11640 [Tepidisphaeraceae bacterium]|jgi:hypothetical protein